MGVLAGEPKIAEIFTYYPVKECPFNAATLRRSYSRNTEAARSPSSARTTVARARSRGSPKRPPVISLLTMA